MAVSPGRTATLDEDGDGVFPAPPLSPRPWHGSTIHPSDPTGTRGIESPFSIYPPDKPARKTNAHGFVRAEPPAARPILVVFRKGLRVTHRKAPVDLPPPEGLGISVASVTLSGSGAPACWRGS
jgi:hypothetical protein